MIKFGKLINIDADINIAVKQASKIYFEGGVFIYPTDTIYGFGANPFNEEAVNRVNEIKGREAGKWYILLINGINDLLKYVELKSEKDMDFLISIWPNPVSVILNLNNKTRSILKRDTAAFRVLLVLLFRFNITETGLGQIEIRKSMSFSDFSSTYFNKSLMPFIKSMYHFPASLPLISFTLFTASSLNGLAPKPYIVSVG